jgi:hypothetical protein
MMYPTSRNPRTWRPDLGLILALLLPVFAWAPLTYGGYLAFRNGFLPVFNLSDLLARGWRPDWTPGIGVAPDLLRGDGSLPYLLGAAVAALGAEPGAATKWVFGLAIVLGSVGMYAWARRRLALWPALIAATAYVYWPALLATIYSRGAYAEAVLFGLMPWAFLAADGALAAPRVGGPVGRPAKTAAALGLAVLLAACAMTQAGLALWFGIVALGYLAILSLRPLDSPNPVWRWLGWGGAALLAILLLVSVIAALGQAGAAHQALGTQQLGLHQLIAARDLAPARGLGLGFVAPALALLAFVVRPLSHDDAAAPAAADLPRVRWYAAGSVVVLVLLASVPSAPLWRALPFLSRTVTQPWQLLLLAGPGLAWLAGLGAERLAASLGGSRDDQRPVAHSAVLAAGLITTLVLGVLPDLHPATVSGPVPTAPLAIYGDNEIALLRAEVVGDPGPGGRMAVAVEWQALRPLGRDYTVFFHVIGPDGQRYAQQDGMPDGGQAPTSGWLPGDIVTDRYEAVLSMDAPIGGAYRYWIGLYDGATGVRLSAGDDDKLVLAQ